MYAGSRQRTDASALPDGVTVAQEILVLFV